MGILVDGKLVYCCHLFHGEGEACADVARRAEEREAAWLAGLIQAGRCYACDLPAGGIAWRWLPAPGGIGPYGPEALPACKERHAWEPRVWLAPLSARLVPRALLHLVPAELLSLAGAC